MGRHPSNGTPPFRFSPSEAAEMENILNEHDCAMPPRDVLQALADKFSESKDREGKIAVQTKQVWNWFQNKRYAIKAKLSKTPGKLNVKPMPRSDFAPLRTMPPPTAAPFPVASGSVPTTGKATPESSVLEFEAKSARDKAWYDVANFVSHRFLETNDPEVLVQFAGFGSEEDEWINVRRNVRPRSLPCESSECVLVIPGDLILCFQEFKEQALYFDAHVLDAQRRRHDVRGCRCRFLVQYLHDKSEEIVPLKKICRRPETEYRLHQLPAVNQAAPEDQQKTAMDPGNVPATRVPSSSEAVPKQQQQNANIPIVTPVPQTNVSQAPANVHGIMITSSSETVPKQQLQEQNANIPIVTPVLQTNASQVPEIMNVDRMKAETTTDANIPITAPVPQTNVSPAPHNIMDEDPKKGGITPDVLSGNDSIVPPGFASTIITGSVPQVPSQNMVEGK